MSTPAGLIIFNGDLGYMTIRDMTTSHPGIQPLDDALNASDRTALETTVAEIVERPLNDIVGNAFLFDDGSTSSPKWPSMCLFRLVDDPETFFIARGMEHFFNADPYTLGVYVFDDSQTELLSKFTDDHGSIIPMAVLAQSNLQPVHSSLTITEGTSQAAGLGSSAHYGSSAHFEN